MTNAETGKVEKLLAAFREDIKNDFRTFKGEIQEEVCTFKDDIKDEFRLQLGIQSEKFQHKLDIVVEGHQILSEKIDLMKSSMEAHFESIENKLAHILRDKQRRT